MHDAADDSAIVRSLDAPDIRRQVRFDPLPLLIAQPKQVVAHDPNPLPKTNQDRIVRAEKLMSSDPSSPPQGCCEDGQEDCAESGKWSVIRISEVGGTSHQDLS